MNLHACLFDLDGVIIDTAKYHYLAWRELATELGFVFTEQDNERLKGVSRMRSLDILLEVGGLVFSNDKKLQLASQKNAHYLELVMRMPPEEVLPGAVDFVQACKKKGLNVGIASASKNAPAILQHMQLSSLFDIVVDGNMVSHTKPNPEVFLIGAKLLSVLPRSCVVFEDAAAGGEAAHRAGMFCVGIGNRTNLPMADMIATGLSKLTVQDVLREHAAHVSVSEQ